MLACKLAKMKLSSYLPMKGVSKREAGGGGRYLLLCVQACSYLKRNPKLEKQEREKKQLSGYKQCYIYKNQSLEASKIINSALINWILEANI